MKIDLWRDLHFMLWPVIWYRPSSLIFGAPFPGALTLQWLNRGIALYWMPRKPSSGVSSQGAVK